MICLDGRTFSCADVAAVAGGAEVTLAADARQVMAASAGTYAKTAAPDLLRRKWQWLMGGTPPSSSTKTIRTFLNGHCAAVGEPLAREEVRALMAVRANVLAKGPSACRPLVVEHLIALLNDDLLPVVPSQGSVGAAGSSVLAHMTVAAFGLGGVLQRSDGTELDAADQRAPELTEKEALSLINGASLATALGALAVERSKALMETALAACGLTFEVVRADLDCLHPAVLQARGGEGCQWVGQTLRDWVAGSQMVVRGRQPDAFSVRCAPVVLGTTADALTVVRATIDRELNASVDNPLLFDDIGVLEGGNFHGAPVALAMDHLKNALVQIASISERRVFRLTYGRLSGLPSFLLPDSGATSGMMLAQYTAASVLSEAKGLCMPNSVDTIPTVQHLEDHVSMGAEASRCALMVADLVMDVVTIELLVAAQGLDFRLSGEALVDGEMVAVEPLAPGKRTKAVWSLIREHVPRWTDDRVMYSDLKAVGDLARSNRFAGI